MSTTIYLLRHGQSLGNKRKSFLGHTDLDLSLQGYEQAAAAAEYIKTLGIDAVFSSPLIRARHTVDAFAVPAGLSVTEDFDLCEIYAGEWEGKTFEYIRNHYTSTYYTFRHDLGNACPDGGESAIAVGDRMFCAVRGIAEQYPDKNILIASHATAICMLTAKVLGLSADAVARLALPTNASLTTLRYDDGVFQLLSYSVNSYLGDLATQLTRF